MRRLAAPVAVAGVLAFVPGPAGATPGSGRLCGFFSVPDAFGDGDWLHGVVDGGPVGLDHGADAGAYGRIVCTVQVDGSRHADADAAVARSFTTPGVAFLEPTRISIRAGSFDNVVLCTQVDVAGDGTYYYDADADGWSTDPTVRCQPSTVPVAEPDPWGLDPAVCPLLMPFFPPDGDVDGVHDCPPYGP